MKNNNSNQLVLAIFPFENLTEGNGFDVFCRSFYIDLLTELSRFRQFTIIALESVMASGGNEKAEGSLLVKPDYLIKGSFRFYNGTIRITAQLVKGDAGHIAWADRYEGDESSIFSIQQALLEQIVIALQQHVNHDLLGSIRKKEPVALSAYENCLYGMDQIRKGSLEADEKAREYFQRALQIAPDYSLACSGMSLTYFNEWSCQFWDRWELSQKGAYEWARKAYDLDEQNYVAALVLGRVYLYEGKYELSEHYLRRALRLNPNDVDSLVQLSTCFVFLGYKEEAQGFYEKVLQLNPLFTDSYNYVGAFIAFERGDFQRCVKLGESGPNPWVDFPGIMAAAYYYLGDHENMERCWNAFLTGFEKKISKGNGTGLHSALQWLMNVNPYRYGTNLQRFWDFLKERDLIQNPPRPSGETRISKNNFIHSGDQFFEISYEGKIIQIVAIKGLQDLVKLLGNPGKEFHCSELMGSGIVASPEFVFDDKARRSYQKKITDLQDEIKICQENNDQVKTELLEKEYDALVEHLSAAIGVGGKRRKLNDSLDKVRSAVTWRIRKAIQKIEKGHPQFGKHLNHSIKTGVFCSYIPEKPVQWET